MDHLIVVLSYNIVTFIFSFTGVLYAFLSIRFVIIDEAHAYKGAFGCHTAFILRRLRRLCHHGTFS